MVTTAQKLEAVSLAAIVGAEEAARQLGYDKRSVRRWREQAGERRELEAGGDELQSLYDLALAKVTADVATGRIKGTGLMTVLGVARDKLDRARRQKAQDAAVDGSSVVAKEACFDWIEDVATDQVATDEDIEPVIAAIGDVVPLLLLRRANLEADPYASAPIGHRAAILAWFSGRPEVEAGDVLPWAQAIVTEVIAEYGSLVGWHAHQQAEDAAEEERRRAADAAIAARAAALKAEVKQTGLDAETAALVAAAEAYLQSSDA